MPNNNQFQLTRYTAFNLSHKYKHRRQAQCRSWPHYWTGNKHIPAITTTRSEFVTFRSFDGKYDSYNNYITVHIKVRTWWMKFLAKRLAISISVILKTELTVNTLSLTHNCVDFPCLPSPLLQEHWKLHGRNWQQGIRIIYRRRLGAIPTHVADIL